MDDLTRRRILVNTAIATAGTTIAQLPPLSAQAAAPPAGKQAPGFYRFRVGSFEVTVVSDGARPRPINDGLVRNVTKERVLAVAEAAFMPKGSYISHVNPIVVNTGAKLILIDTGFGPRTGPNVGLLPATLTSAGIDPKTIDIVVISHMHGDHILGLRTLSGDLAFPNAEIKVPEKDWAFWMNDSNMSKASEDFTKSTFTFNRTVFGGIADKVTRYDWGEEVAPGITAIDTSGHTPGHSSFVIASGSDRLLFQGDVTNVPALFLRNPDWQIVFDHEPEKAAQTRRRVLDMASAEKMLVAGYHFPFPGLGYVEKDGLGYRLVPAPWLPYL
jgi:glyoxylase-like metal-dependent hydrolase (beta-lactamase superfamily II)